MAVRHHATFPVDFQVAVSSRRLANLHEGTVTEIGGKLNLKTKDVVAALGSERLFQRLRFHQWLKPLYQSRDAIYPAASVVRVQQRMENGELPPLLPSEIKQREARAVN